MTLTHTHFTRCFHHFTQFFWDMFVVKAAVGTLLLTALLCLNGTVTRNLEDTISLIAKHAQLGAAPEGMIYVTQCAKSNTRDLQAISDANLCPTRHVEALSIEDATQNHALPILSLLLALYYLAGLCLGYTLHCLYHASALLIPKACSLIKSLQHRQFEKDVNWCMAKIEQHFSGKPYWEEWNIAAFSRQGNGDALYWADVNQEATKRITAIPTTLHHPEAYREMNRMALFSLNVIASALLYTDEASQHGDTLEEIIELTHQQLIRRAPSSITEHDEALRCSQTCLNHFCRVLNAPCTDFFYYSKKLHVHRWGEFDVESFDS